MNEPAPKAGIAIVGMSGRFPGAPTTTAFWENLRKGVESIARFDITTLADAFDEDVRSAPDFVAARAIVTDVDLFDAAFFGISSRDAENMDPQHRIFLECCWEALEDAGYDPAVYPGTIGVYAGSSINTYVLRNVLSDRAVVHRFTSEYQVGSFSELLGAGQDFLATRVAYKLDLRGPAMTVGTACSTSLSAVAQACQTLTLRQADMMLAGAVSITFPQRRGYVHQAGGMVSADGHCRTFDESATGTVFGDGAGVVVLKRLDDAIADGDSIYAVIRGFGVTNDGAAKAGFTAPSVAGQAAAIAAAHRMADFDPRTIRFVECHGTATPLGDPIEFAALLKVFPAAETPAYCALGSVKTNVGHLDAAAGMSGLIKTALAVRTGQIPPTLHYRSANSRIPLSGSPFFVNTEIQAWPQDGGQRRAGVSAFGVGGTNVHLAIEEAPSKIAASFEGRTHQLLVVSARTPAALTQARERLAQRLSEAPVLELSDVAYTLQAGRRAFPHRFAATASTIDGAIAQLRKPLHASTHARGDAPAVGFMFPGQGAQYVGMCHDLDGRFPVFRETLDRCAAIAEAHDGTRLRDLLFPEQHNEETSRRLTVTSVAQPALFAVEYALAQLWMSFGIRPAAMIGHSVGEFVAATIAGVFSLETALGIILERGRLMQSLPAGAMLAVRLDESSLAPMLAPSISLAAVNSPRLSVAAGPCDEIERLERELASRNVACRRLPASHAFHSTMMDDALAPLFAYVANVELREPVLPYVSGITGDWITAEEATSPHYWTRHCRETIRFDAALHTAVAGGIGIFLEVGPGNSLATCARQTIGPASHVAIVACARDAERLRDDREVLLEAIGKMWSHGVAPDWQAVHAPARPQRVALPSYPFERRRFWIEEPVVSPPLSKPQQESRSLPHERVLEIPSTSTGARIESDLLALIEELSGDSITENDLNTSFLELGFDSLFLGRLVQKITPAFGVSITFRALMTDIPTIASLATHIEALRPARSAQRPLFDIPGAAAPATVPADPAVPIAAAQRTAFAEQNTASLNSAGDASGIEFVVREQLAAMQQLMRNQLEALRTTNAGAPTTGNGAASVAPLAAGIASIKPIAIEQQQPSQPEPPSRFDVYRPGARATQPDITVRQREHIADLVARTTARTRRSKEITAKNRAKLADPRVAAGFRAEWKEMVYPVACDRAKGSRLWDIDGNEYIDVLNGFGQTAFGHSPDFVIDAVTKQLGAGFPIGPQTPLVGEVTELFCELTGNERVTFCNTGSEAVMAALRVARAVTGRDRVVMFSGAYHGQFDEVLVKAARTSGRALPVAPGIPAASVTNMVVLPYADPTSLEWVREHADELAAVIVEPVQSRHPDLATQAFLTEIRSITQASGTAFVMDEVVTGFRVHPGGMQAVFGIRADLATYGKVIGGGMPVGILAGTARFMNALDGGAWQFGDESSPEVPPTFFAGTFVRHPLVMAAVLAVLRHLKAEGPALQSALTALTADLVDRLNGELAIRAIESRVETYASLFYFNFSTVERLAPLLVYHLRLRGVYIADGFPCFLTTAHAASDVDSIVAAFADSLDELQRFGIFGDTPQAIRTPDIPLTEQQTEIWLVAQLGDEASCAFNESLTLQLEGTLDEPAFAAAWNTLIARHDALRARFDGTGESMHLSPHAACSFPLSDLSNLDRQAAETQLAAIIANDAATPFDLISGAPVRGHLVRLDARSHAFIFTAHHIVCDGWSINVLLDEFATIYRGRTSGVPAQLPPALSFSTYARSRSQVDRPQRERIETFWLDAFREPIQELRLPVDRQRPTRRSYRGATVTKHIDAERYRSIKKAGARQGCTLFVTLLSTFGALIGRLARTTDVVVGIPAAGQSLLDGDILVGHCVDFLPIRARWNAGTSLDVMLASMKVRVLEAYEHQDYTLGTLVRELAPARETNRVPLAEIQFNLERMSESFDLPGLRVTTAPNAKAFVNFDVFLNVIESEHGLRLDCDYNTDILDGSTVERWLASYVGILDALVADAAMPIDVLPLVEALPAAVPAALRERTADFPRDATIVSLFREHVGRNPLATAAICGADQLNYLELDARVRAVAAGLRGRLGSSGGRIAICLPRSLDMLVALLAALDAGFTYVPLDPTHPIKRLSYIAGDARVCALMSDGHADPTIAPAGTPILDFSVLSTDGRGDERATSAEAGSAAYVIYTSGSTGTPKGVEILHRSLTNFVCSMAREPGFSSADRLLAVTTIAFDIAGLELYVPLATGGTVVIAQDAETRNGALLADRLRTSYATALQATPATWRMLVETDFAPAAGFKMLCGGEALGRDLADRLLALGGDVWNMYGPTETTIWSSCGRVASSGPVTVGRPIANTQFSVLNEVDRVVPAGATGQLHIGGDGVARGYVDRPDLTAEKFIPDPFGSGRLYRTGDTARMLPTGEFEILGRMDQQIKLRGYRIELGEIEATLTQHGMLSAAAVILHEPEQRLVAYYVERPDLPITESALRLLAAEHLPDYMVPTMWVKLAELPLNANGKVDRKAIPPALLVARTPGNSARTPTERALAEIWADVFAREHISVDDDIFELGADSIQIFQITARANRRGLRLLAKQLMKHRTIAALAKTIDLADDDSKHAAFGNAGCPADAAHESVGQRYLAQTS